MHTCLGSSRQQAAIIVPWRSAPDIESQLYTMSPSSTVPGSIHASIGFNIFAGHRISTLLRTHHARPQLLLDGMICRQPARARVVVKAFFELQLRRARDTASSLVAGASSTPA